MRGHLRGCWSGQVAPGGPKSSPGAAELGDGVGKSGVFPCEHSRRGAVPRSRSSAFQSHSRGSWVSPPSHSPPLLPKSINPAGDQSLALGPGRSLPRAIPDPGAGCGSGTARAQSCSNPWNRGWKGPCSEGFYLGRSILSVPAEGILRRNSSWNPGAGSFWGAVGYSGMLWNAPGCLGMLQDIPGILWDTQECSGMSMGCRGIPGMLRMPWDPSGMLRNSHPPSLQG